MRTRPHHSTPQSAPAVLFLLSDSSFHRLFCVIPVSYTHLHQAAKNAFDDMGVKKLPKVKELQTEYAKLLEEKKKTYAEYRRSREEMRGP